MRNPINTLLAMLMPSTTAQPDTAPPRQPVRMIAGGRDFPELCQLAEDWKGGIDFDGYRVNQLKADGIRAVYIDGRIVTREGVPLDCAMHCQPGLRRLEADYGHPMVFDGEYVADDGFNATLAEQRKGEGSGVFWLFDAIPHGAWVLGGYDVPIEVRLADLRFRADKAQSLFVGMLDFKIQNAADTIAWVRELWAAGFEGIVSKKGGSHYSRMRSREWLKVKELHCNVCTVVDTVERDGKLRSIIVRGAEPGAKPITLTGGWSEVQAASILHNTARGAPVNVEAEFYLTTGKVRTVRSPKFKGLL
jgi:ATP-dependent DNA ligase